MNLEEKLKKIDYEINIGLKYKAADRLRNLIQVNPDEIQLWNKLAELYYESGFIVLCLFRKRQIEIDKK